jgi:integrase
VQEVDDFILTLRRQSNVSKKYEAIVRKLLLRIDIKTITQSEMLDFLNSHLKPESIDPLHKSVGTRNYYLGILKRFFKWYGKNNCMDGIKLIRIKEQSIYKSTDLWTPEDDLLFLKYCNSKRDRFYHMAARDTSCRPHELLGAKVKDAVFKIGDNGIPYAEILVNGKTGTRAVPLIDSLPYLKVLKKYQVNLGKVLCIIRENG